MTLATERVFRRKLWFYAFVPTICMACSSKYIDLINPGERTVPIWVPDSSPALRHSDVCGLDEASSSGAGEPSLVDGTWSGQMSDYAFPSGSSKVVMVLAHQSSGAIAGTVTLGDPSSSGLAFSTRIQYPVDANDPPPPLPPYDGLSYTVLDGTLEGMELSVGIEPREFWQPWCESQGDVYDNPSSVNCASEAPISDRFTDPAGNQFCAFQYNAMPCNQVALCLFQKGFRSVVSGVCDCSKAGCSVCLSPMSAPVTFHLAVQGDTLTGAAEAFDTPSMGFLAETFSGKRLTLTRL